MNQLEPLAAEVREIADEEREYYDNMPESIQLGEKGERADEVATILEEVADAIDESLSQLESAQE